MNIYKKLRSQINFYLLLLGLMLTQSCSSSPALDADIIAASGGETNPKVIPLSDYKQVLELFDELNYTTEAWQAGIREVPRVYISEITDRWSKVTTKEIDVNLKKKLFFRTIGPLALRSNELILEDRSRVETLLKASTKINAKDQDWLNSLASEYRLEPTDYADPVSLASALLLRVDIVPASLVLAQAAEESGWGTSRFAFTGNALFGQWTWGDKGIRPTEQRAGKGDYKIAAFDAPLQSVQAHARNLNSHRAYAEFRAARAKLRAANARINGHDLAASLISYSERGEEYVKTLRSIMSFNRLDPADDAYLGNNQPIVLVDPNI
jgi:Bax protein